MVAVLDYNTVLSEASSGMERSKRDVSVLFGGRSLFSVVMSWLFSTREQALARTIDYQLFLSAWLLGDAQKKYDTLVGIDWSSMILRLNKLIGLNLEMQAKIESLLAENADSAGTLKKYHAELEETISNLYSCLRLFKRATLKTTHSEPSDIALSAAGRSADTIHNLYAGN